MTELPSFHLRLNLLMQLRQLDIGGLSRAAAVPESDLRAIFDGVRPSPSTIRRLAPALGLHAADCFVMADLAVPDDLAPQDGEAGSAMDQLVKSAIRLTSEQRRWLREYVKSLSRREGGFRAAVRPAYAEYRPGAGAIIVRMLHNRNLDWLNSAKILYRLTGVGPLSASTIGAIGHGRKELSAGLVAGFAQVLAVHNDVLTAMAGLELSEPDKKMGIASSDIGELIWEARFLTVDQIRYVYNKAEEKFAA